MERERRMLFAPGPSYIARLHVGVFCNGALVTFVRVLMIGTFLLARGVLPYIGYTGMCRWKGYGFQAIWSGIGSSNHSKLV